MSSCILRSTAYSVALETGLAHTEDCYILGAYSLGCKVDFNEKK